MSEKQQQNQTHGYNSKAAEAIAAMPKDEQGLPVPNETAYNNSQVILDSDPNAMARSLEMQQWSDKAGEYAEKASAVQQEQSRGDLNRGATHEQVKRNALYVSEVIANKGVQTSGERRIRALDGGMETITELHPTSVKVEIDRSPAHIRLSQEEIREKAIRNAKKIV